MKTELRSRLEERAMTWRVDLESVVHTATALIAFGRRDDEPVVLKVVKRAGEEWRAGPVIEAFAGRGVVRALEHGQGAVLMERLVPGTSLASAAISDHETIEIIAEVIGRMAPERAPTATRTVESWGESFERRIAHGVPVVPRSLIDRAHRITVKLCASQGETRLLHGDLHHHNVVFDDKRGWTAIDPKGVVGELAYEVGAALRNPRERHFADPMIIRDRVDGFVEELRLDRARVLEWAFAQAVLAAIWELEDDGAFSAGTGWITLANAIQPMIDG